MTVRFEDRGPPVDDAALAAFEVRRGLRLPPDYRGFLLDRNGGRLGDHEFFALGSAGMAFPGDELDLGGDVPAEDWPELLRDLEARLLWARSAGDPADLIPIAEAPRGLLALRLDVSGAVVLDYDPDGYCEWHLARVADSFTALLRGLTAPT